MADVTHQYCTHPGCLTTAGCRGACHYDNAALFARLAASRVPDELMAALATLFHGYCRLEDTGLKFTMQVGPEPYLQIGIDPHAHVKAWRVIHDTLYPAAPSPEVKK